MNKMCEEDRKLMQRLGLMPIELYHATAYHAWSNGQKPGDAELTLDRNMYFHVDEFNQSFFMPLNEPCSKDSWKPVGIVIAANVKSDGLTKIFDFEYVIPKGRRLQLIGNEESVNVGSAGNERNAPVYRYKVV